MLPVGAEGQCLIDQRGLADPGQALHQHELRMTLRRTLPRHPDLGKFVGATGERRLHGPHPAPRSTGQRPADVGSSLCVPQEVSEMTGLFITRRSETEGKPGPETS